ncbi:MAG: ABC transporter ATP-binding protein [Candidatus Methanofastidiosia archaeon]
MRYILRLLNYLKPHDKTIFFLTLLMLTNSVMTVLIPQITRYIIDEVYPRGDFALLTKISLSIVFFFVIKAGIYFINMYHTFRITQKVIMDLRMKLYKHIQRLSLSYFESTLSGRVVSKIITDVNSLQDLILATAARLIGHFVTLIGVIIVIFWMNFDLGVLIVTIIPALFLVMFRFSQKIKILSKKIQKKTGEMTGIVTEMLSGIRVVKSFAMERSEYEKFHAQNLEFVNLNLLRRREIGIIYAAMEFLSQFGILLVLWGGGYLVMRNSLTLGELTAYILYVGLLIRPVVELVMFINIVQRGLASLERIFEMLDTEEEVFEKKDAITLDEVKGEIEFSNVSFSYRRGERALKNVSFKAKAGKTIALVGPSGSGKTSIVNLILRFYDPTDGKILFGGVDVKDLKLDFLRDQMGIVLQEDVLFSGTVRENISYGRRDAEFSEILEVSKYANAHDFIEKLPKGYETQVGERGIKLSGGEKQRISIARALLKNPKILILDEATSSLDSESELLIQNALEKLLKNRTTFVIAHRLSTVMAADKILVLDDGEIVEEGTHRELLERRGLYKKLYDMQFEKRIKKEVLSF